MFPAGVFLIFYENYGKIYSMDGFYDRINDRSEV